MQPNPQHPLGGFDDHRAVLIFANDVRDMLKDLHAHNQLSSLFGYAPMPIPNINLNTVTSQVWPSEKTDPFGEEDYLA